MARQGLMDDSGYDFFDVSDCSNYESCREDAFNDGYEKGRADMKIDFIGMLEREFAIQNNANSKFVETIVLRRNFVEQLKEQKNG